ncbi:uncharacterized protein METZ01_LOCUS289302 [marine metagenome]|uniref:Uncharacterized protein n=1 Tax=marine metagenome TaxID=408172 RepID=A0A382LI50_9ZZZZ
MMASIVSFILAHQGDAADPELLRWIKVQMDHLVGSGPWAVVAVMGIVILSMPVFIVVVYVMQSKRRSDVTPMNQERQEQERVR